MTFTEAKDALKKLAAGRYCSMRFEMNVAEDGREFAVIDCYIAGIGWARKGNGYEVTLANMAALIEQKVSPEILEEMLTPSN